MIISHKHKFIFFAVPKTATHSVREALRLHKSEQDWEQQMLFGKQLLPIPEIAKLEHGHISVKEIEPCLPSEQWSEYFKLAFVRNPFDRFVSACAFLNRGNAQFSQRPLEWMKVAMTRDQFKQRLLIRPQSMQLIDNDGELAMDYVGRYESLQTSMDQIFDHLLLPKTELAVRNSSKHADYQTYYDDELREQLEDFYAQDLMRFNYHF